MYFYDQSKYILYIQTARTFSLNNNKRDDMSLKNNKKNKKILKFETDFFVIDCVKIFRLILLSLISRIFRL